jgi:hypothetical protein
VNGRFHDVLRLPWGNPTVNLGSSPGIGLHELIGSSVGFTCRCLIAATDAAARKVPFKRNTAEDALTILRFVTNYLAVEPTAQMAAVG